ESLELNMEQFNMDRQSASFRQLIQEDIENGRKIGVRGTPAVFINGKRIDNKELRNLTRLIRREVNNGVNPAKAE
ncbi:MAG: thioredoxin domain-containing protein, partial [Desulfosarcina sp.]|nr:thioredoxin domain-containing protein [Desulfosarcina sp.]MBC2767180.1 thioredoxin domain-containing protein [Desulfosarcina sp.]